MGDDVCARWLPATTTTTTAAIVTEDARSKCLAKKGKEGKRASEQVKAIAAEASFSVDADQGNKKSCPQL